MSLSKLDMNNREENHVEESNGVDVSDNIHGEVTIITPPPSVTATSLLTKHHPLKHRWTLWFLNDKKNLEWTERLKQVCTFTSAEEFWSIYDNIRPPSCQVGCDYNLFKEGIEPMWEVPLNREGGRLVIVLERKNSDLLDVMWLDLLLALIGEQFGKDTESICGAVCNIRNKGSKISLWTTNSSDDDTNKRIGEVMKAQIVMPRCTPGSKPFVQIRYEDHKAVQQKTSSIVPVKFVL
uniref:EIF-4F 25 kDa subunit n=1 Tax=Acrobeloides nanus TaxID=290746 RepID=A0A914CED3_9BILA